MKNRHAAILVDSRLRPNQNARMQVGRTAVSSTCVAALVTKWSLGRPEI